MKPLHLFGVAGLQLLSFDQRKCRRRWGRWLDASGSVAPRAKELKSDASVSVWGAAARMGIFHTNGSLHLILGVCNRFLLTDYSPFPGRNQNLIQLMRLFWLGELHLPDYDVFWQIASLNDDAADCQVNGTLVMSHVTTPGVSPNYPGKCQRSTPHSLWWPIKYYEDPPPACTVVSLISRWCLMPMRQTTGRLKLLHPAALPHSPSAKWCCDELFNSFVT